MPASINEEAASLLQHDWQIQVPDVVTKEAIIAALSQRIALLLERGTETFFQLMYRLDIPERKLQAVMQDSDAIEKIAALVYDRQVQKIISRQQYKQQQWNGDEDDLKW